MKKNLVFSLIFMIVNLSVSCIREQPSGTKSSEDTLGRTSNSTSDTSNIEAADINSVAGIKEVYGATMSQLENGKLDSITMEYSCENDAIGGTITYFSEKEELRFIKHTYHEYDHYSASDLYFVADDILYFVFLKSASWSFVSAEVTQDKFTEQRIYIVKEQAVQCLENKYTIMSNTPDQRQEETGNKNVDCMPIDSIVKDFQQLLAFKDQPNQGCLGK